MKCLIIMPFAKQFDQVHEVIKRSVADAVRGVGIGILRLDEVRTAGKITSQLVDALHSADFYIADLTGHNPNVMWEVGFAAAVGRPAIFISQSADPLPFDVKDERVVRYNRRKLESTLYHPLKDAVEQTLQAYAVKASAPEKRTIAVTGTATIHSQRALGLLTTILDPYLSRHFRWLCGATGTTDEVALNFLVEKGERVALVYDGVYQVTATAQELAKQHSLQKIDAEKALAAAAVATEDAGMRFVTPVASPDPAAYVPIVSPRLAMSPGPMPYHSMPLSPSSQSPSVNATEPAIQHGASIDTDTQQQDLDIMAAYLKRLNVEGTPSIAYLLLSSDLLILLGNPTEGRTEKLVAGALQLQRPYLLVRP